MTCHSVRVTLPYHLQNLARVGPEIILQVEEPVSPDAILDVIEREYPMLRGTIREHVTKRRRPLLRYFACGEDISHLPTDTILPDAIAAGREPFMIWGAVAGG